jgi:hypothetical protein
MPIGYLVTTALMVAVALPAAARHRPRRSHPFRLSGVFGFVLNWPLVAFALLAASTALAVAQSGVGSPVFWTEPLGLGDSLISVASLTNHGVPAGLHQRPRRATELLMVIDDQN